MPTPRRHTTHPPAPPLGKADHNLVHLLPVYKPLVQREPATTRTVKRWSEEAEEALKDCFEATVWEVLSDCHGEDIDSMTSCIMDYINFCVENTVPTRTVRCFSNTKPWITPELKALLKEKRRAFNSGNKEELKAMQKELWRNIRRGKEGYKKKMEEQLQQSDVSRQTGSHSGHQNPDGSTNESSILDSQRAGRATLVRQAENLCTATKARNDAVLGILGLPVQDVTWPSPRPPPLPKRSIRSPQRRRKIAPRSDVPRLNTKDIDRHQSPGSLDEEDDSFWEKVLLGSQMAVLACKEAQMADGDQSPTSSLSSVDCKTPSELRAIALIEEPTTPPPPPPHRAVTLFRRRTSRLPVLSAEQSGAEKEVADGCRLQSAKGKVEAFVERLKSLQLASIPSPRPPAAPTMTPAATLLAPTPPRVPQAKKRGTRPGVALRPAKAVSVAGKDTTTDCSPNAAKDKKVKKTELQQLTNPVQSLSACFKLLSLNDWEKKIDGLKIIQALAQHHLDTLRTKLHEVCLVLIVEVNNLRSAVACEAMDTLAELYVHLQKAMDPEAEGTGRALLLKLAQATSAFIHQQANLALDALVDNCSHGRIVSALLNAGLSHRCAAVRGSMAQHLHQLADSLGATRILRAGRTLTERFLLAVSKMCVDGAPEVRHHGQIVLLKLADHKGFIKPWTKIIPVNQRSSLDKILKKAKK
uniref:uncharacterized protein LOC117269794 n=1 Tax=Epinephelus lanceolatus TaxID=310571 RepID=UPI0014481A1F|nr:uncharacterized protein LOC117269794 [Epinephelus lanceolatus]